MSTTKTKKKVSSKNSETKLTKAQEKASAKAAEVAQKQKEQVKYGELIVQATQKGVAMADANGADVLTDFLNKSVRKLVSEEVVITDTGMRVKHPEKVTELQLTTIISGLGSASERTKDFLDRLTWNLGDAGLLAEQFEGGVDRVVAQAISERGVTKHTTLQAIRRCKEWSYESRIKGAGPTIHSELMNYRGSVTPQKFTAIVKEVRELAAKGECPSCSELRTALQEASGKKPKASKVSKNGSAHEEKACTSAYLYITESGSPEECFVHDDLSEMALEDDSITVIDLNSLSVLNKKGSPKHVLKELSADYFPPAEPVEDAPKGKKPKAKVEDEEESPPE